MNKSHELSLNRGIDSFPSMPAAAARMLTLMDDANANASQIEKVLRWEPGLTANILKLTNSAYFGLSRKIGSVRQAVVLLGWKRVAQLVITTCVNAIMNRPISGYKLPVGELWRHSIAVSVAAEGLAKEVNLAPAEEIFTAALVHDLGKLVLDALVRDELQAIEMAASQGVPFEVAEHMVLGTDHAEIGARILEGWSFPSEIVMAVRWHHDPDSAAQPGPLVDIIHVANILCLMIGLGLGVEGLHHEPSFSATERLGIKVNHLEVVASHTLKWVNELSNIFETN